MNSERIAGFIALKVTQDVFEMIVAFLIKIDDATITVGLQTGKGVARFDVRLHIPCAVMQPMVVVAPDIHHTVLSDGDVVYNTVEGHVAIDIEQRLVDAVVVVAALHVVVGPNGEAYPAPGRCLLPLRVEGQWYAIAIEGASLLGDGHNGVYLWRDGILDKLTEELVRIKHIPRPCVVDFEVQVGSR